MVVNLYLLNFILNVKHVSDCKYLARWRFVVMNCYIQSYAFLKFAILGIPNITILIFTCQQSQTGLINGCELENATLFYHYEILFAIYFYFANGFPVFPLTLS